MKKELESRFEIRLDFERQTENPSRLFRSFADIIEGVNNFDYLIAESVNTKVTSKVFLDDIEKGSLIGKLYSALVISEDGQIDNIDDSEKVEEYIEETRAESLKFIADKKSSIEDVKNLQESIMNVAQEKGLNETFNYSPPDILKIAKSINNINDATKGLREGESFELKSPNSEVKSIKSGVPKIDLEAVETALTQNEIINESELFYKIKKPDFLGDSAWGFKHGKKSLTVKILDEDWLKKFHAGTINIVPGDSLQVLVRQTSKYNRNGYLISEKVEIIEVKNIIHNN